LYKLLQSKPYLPSLNTWRSTLNRFSFARDKYLSPYGHGFHIYDYLIRVPLVVKGPGTYSSIQEKQIRQIDTLPILLDLLDIRLDLPATVTGSGLDQTSGKEKRVEDNRPAYCIACGTVIDPKYWLEAIRNPPWKYITSYGGDTFEELYNIEVDPLERRDLSKRRSLLEVKRDCRAILCDIKRQRLPRARLSEDEDIEVSGVLKELGYL
jgi:arylsulfatase A-like enzyme